MKSTVIAPLAVFLIVILLSATACSGDSTGKSKSETSKNSSKGKTGAVEGTLSSTTTGVEKTERTGPVEGTIGVSPKAADVVLRIEGDPKTRFSGICVEGGDESVLNGSVPKRYRYDLSGEKLSCRIQKQDKAKGSLNVILIAGGATHSVQQVDAPGSVIKISYQGTG